MAYRELLKYPPAAHILAVLVTSKEEQKGLMASELISGATKDWIERTGIDNETVIIGPAPASLAKANDIYRFVIYMKQANYDVLIRLKDYLEGYVDFSEHLKGCNVQFDFNPMNSY